MMVYSKRGPGRPSKEADEVEAVTVPAPVEREVSKRSLGYKIISYVDFLNEAREMLKEGKVNGMIEPLDVALCLIEEKFEIVRIFELKGNIRIVVKRPSISVE